MLDGNGSNGQDHTEPELQPSDAPVKNIVTDETPHSGRHGGRHGTDEGGLDDISSWEGKCVIHSVSFLLVPTTRSHTTCDLICLKADI